MATAAPPLPVLATTRGRQILVLLCAVAFLDFVDASIVNVALPSVRADLQFSIQSLQWVLSGYMLTYGGFMLLGVGRPISSVVAGCWSRARRCSSPRHWRRGWRAARACWSARACCRAWARR
jgi:MFS family permease